MSLGRIHSLITVLIHFLIGIILVDLGFAQELSVNLEEKIAIGDQNNAAKEYLFGGPKFISTDSNSNIYVATVNNSIRIFDRKGNHIKTIGTRGRGPGEFLSISGMTIGFNNELVVYDGRSRRITKFYNLGDSLETFSSSHPAWMGGVMIPIDQNRFLTASLEESYIYQMTDDYKPAGIGDSLLHLTNNNFSKRIRSYYSISDHMFNMNLPIESKFAQSNYRLAKLNDSTVVITNQIYNGFLYLVNLTTGTVEKKPGHFTGKKSYEVLDWDNKATYAENRIGLVISGGNYKVVYQKKIESRNLLTNSSWILNFVQTIHEDEYTYNIEFFNKSGEYIGFTKIHDDFITIDGIKQKFYPKHIDDQNNLYYVDYSSNVPVIRVTKITLEE